MAAPRPERRPPSAPPRARLPWADIQDSSQEPNDSLLVASLEPSQLYGDTPNSFEDSQAHLGLRFAQTVSMAPPTEEVAESQGTQLDEEEEEEEEAADARHGRASVMAEEPSVFESTPQEAPRAGGPPRQPAPVALDLDRLLCAGQPGGALGGTNPVGEQVEYFSATSSQWIPAKVMSLTERGTYNLDVKADVAADRVRFAGSHSAPKAGRPQQAKPATPPRVRKPASSSEAWNVHNLRTSAQKRRRPGAAGPPSEPTAAPEPSEHDWPRKLAKRREAVAAVKRTPEYKEARSHGLRDASNVDLPLTPDPTDKTLSKRKWEDGVQAWRRNLKRHAEVHQQEIGVASGMR